MMKHIRNLRNNNNTHTENSPPPSSSASPIKRTNSAKRNTAPFAEVNGRTDTSPVTGKTKAPLPPRPPGSNAVKRKLGSEFGGGDGGGASGSAGSTDTGVQVIVRMRPPNSEDEGELIVQKTSDDTLSILGQPFTFDSVADVASTQADIFHLVGAPLVENCLSGFNSSVFAYGQTGSGKTYTMWGLANALLDNELTSDQQGLTPRVFERLFSRINEEQQKHADKQLVYQCRCSFLEIYNEQITDLLNPAQGNLLIREDTKTGLYVENLTEEPVCSIKEVTRLLKKGLSNRRTGATSINMESSRSHSVFTCVVESRGKSVDGLSSFKTSRINLVDLAGSERQKLTRAAGDRLKEAGNINRSLSQLGNLINILAEVSQTGKQRHIPYRDSKLTFLLQDSLGGNAKLVMVCAISPVESCRSETYSTLRFAQRAKAIKNKAVVNEEMQDDVKSLREVIRQLKDELQRMKENGNQTDPGAGYSTGWNARRSLNLLKFSLNHPLMQPRMDDDNDEEMEIVDEAEHVILAATEACKSLDSDNPGSENCASLNDANLGLIPSEVPVVLKSPTLSASPRVTSSNRQSLRTSSTLTASQNDLASISTFAATNRLAASLHHGLEVIDKHRKSSVLGRSLFRSSYKPVVGEPKSDRKEVGVQTVSMDNEFLCSNCKCKNMDEVKEINDGSDLQLVPVNESPSDLQLVPVNESPTVDNNSKQIVPKKVEKVLAGAIRREMALEEFCTKQHTEIMQLNRLVQQYQHERECNSIIGQLQEDKIARLENLMEGVLSAEDFVNEELISLADNNKILKEKYENHPEILKKEMELKSVQEELERYKNYFDMGERDVLMEEIVDLRSQLQSYMDCSPKLTKKPTPVLQITYGESAVESAEQKLESERIRFTETESKWITLVEELKCELEANRLLCEKQKQELDIARKCSSEQKEAMQMAMQVHARLLENYADLQEKHTDMLINKRKIQDGIEDIKKAAARAGVKGAESRFINALASELSTLKVEREKERKRFRDENKGLQEQLRDTAEAVEAAGELLVRLKEAEEAVAAAQARAAEAEQEAENAYKQIEKLRKKQKVEVSPPPVYDMPIYDKGESSTTVDQHPIADLNNFCNMDTEELTTLPEPSSWFSGYDRCNI